MYALEILTPYDELNDTESIHDAYFSKKYFNICKILIFVIFSYLANIKCHGVIDIGKNAFLCPQCKLALTARSYRY